MKVRIGLVNAIERIVESEQNKIIDLPIKYHSFTEFVNIACAKLIQEEQERGIMAAAAATELITAK
jgi:hypothetical protein